jgi:RimJ/RimL family protein N-acetyltransferase
MSQPTHFDSSSSSAAQSVVLRRAEYSDVDAVMEIINSAKTLLREDGIPQWQNGTPNRETIISDIDRGWSYVLDLGGTVVASAALMEGPDPNYAVIYDGEWQQGSDIPYAAIHRTCVSSRHHGLHLGARLLSSLVQRGRELGVRQFRIDTHDLNVRMQHLIAQAGFVYAGIVRMDNDPEDLRRVYQLFTGDLAR